MTIASWNVREALPELESDSVEHARAELASTVVDHGVDVLALQEVDFTPNGESPTIEHIVEHTGLRHWVARRLSPSSYFDGHQAGVAIVSRFPLTEPAEGDFLNPRLSTELGGTRIGSHDKGFVAATVQVPNGAPFRMVSLHAVPYHLFDRDPGDAEFRAVWADVAAAIVPFVDGPLVVGGDFNTSNRRLLLDVGALPLTQVFPTAVTYKGMSADDVLVSKHFRGTETKVLANFSDHLLCLARVEF